MAGVTSLLRSAQSAQKKIQAQQDAIQAFQWESSPQTYEDYINYSNYLQSRAKTTTDVSSAVSLQGKIRSAQRTYTSNELQRQTMQIMEGNGTTQGKMEVVKNLYDQAVSTGDYNLAQNLASQWDSLTIKLQNEQESLQRSYNTMAMNNVKSLKELVNKMQKGDPAKIQTGEDYIQLPGGDIVKSLGQLNAEFQTTGNSQLAGGKQGNLFKEAADTVKAMQDAITNAYNGATTQEAVDSIEQQFGGILDGTKTIKFLGMDLTPQDIKLAAESDAANNPIYSIQSKRNESTGKQEFSLKKNKVEDFVWARTGTDPVTGEDIYSPINVRTSQDNLPWASLDTKLDANGNPIKNSMDSKGKNITTDATGKPIYANDSNTIKNRLATLGIQANQNSDGTIDVTIPGKGTYQAVITADGTIRYYGDPGQYSGGNPGLYEINLTDKSNFGLLGDIKAGTTREVSPEETSIFGTQSKYGGLLSVANQAGNRIMDIYTGKTSGSERKVGPLDKINLSANNIGGAVPVLGRGLQGSGISGTLGAAKAQAEAVAQKRQAMANQLQNALALNLNQTPVQQYASNGAPIRQLSVAPAPKQPTVTVAPPKPQQTVTVNNNKPTGTVKVVDNSYKGKLTVK